MAHYGIIFLNFLLSYLKLDKYNYHGRAAQLQVGFKKYPGSGRR